MQENKYIKKYGLTLSKPLTNIQCVAISCLEDNSEFWGSIIDHSEVVSLIKNPGINSPIYIQAKEKMLLIRKEKIERICKKLKN